jgi:hypothetical protein
MIHLQKTWHSLIVCHGWDKESWESARREVNDTELRDTYLRKQQYALRAEWLL